MNRKVIFGIILIVAILAALLIVSQILPDEKITKCKTGDGTCPEGCTYDLDHDCPATGVTTYGEIHRCLSDANCVAVRPLCGSLTCIHTYKECTTDKFCITAINKAYLNVWNNAKIQCTKEVDFSLCPEIESANYKVVCDNGECRAQQVAT
jgi:hypothetical protein